MLPKNPKAFAIQNKDLFSKVEDLWLERQDSIDLAEKILAENQLLKSKLRASEISYTQTLAERERRISKLTEDFSEYKQNHEYALAHVNKQNQLINATNNATRIVVESLRSEIQKLKQEKVNSEHLARKAIELQEKIKKLETELHNLICPHQKFPNDPFYIPCGKCYGCKLEAAEGIIDRASKNAEKLQNENDLLTEQVGIKRTALDKTALHLISAKKEIDALKVQSRQEREVLTTEIKNLTDFITKQSEKIGQYRKIIDFQQTTLEGIADDDGFFTSRKKSERARQTLCQIKSFKDKHGIS